MRITVAALKRFLILFITGSLLFSCSSINTTSLDKNPSINKNFSKQDIKELDRIVAHFSNEVCQPHKSFCSCMEDYTDLLKLNIKEGEFKISLEPTAHKQFFKSLSPDFKEKIWVEGKVGKAGIPEEEAAFVHYLNPAGEYRLFLKDLSSTNIGVEDYSSAFDFSSEINGSMIYQMMSEIDKFNCKQKSHQLIFAIHYLTLNDLHLALERQ